MILTLVYRKETTVIQILTERRLCNCHRRLLMRLVLLNYGWVADRRVHFVATTPYPCQLFHSLWRNYSISSTRPRMVVSLWQILKLDDNLLAKVTCEAVQLVEDWHDFIRYRTYYLSNLICCLDMSTQISLTYVFKLFCKHRNFAYNHIKILFLFILLVSQSFNYKCVINFLRPDSIKIMLQLILLQLFAL